MKNTSEVMLGQTVAISSS